MVRRTRPASRSSVPPSPSRTISRRRAGGSAPEANGRNGSTGGVRRPTPGYHRHRRVHRRTPPAAGRGRGRGAADHPDQRQQILRLHAHAGRGAPQHDASLPCGRVGVRLGGDQQQELVEVDRPDRRTAVRNRSQVHDGPQQWRGGPGHIAGVAAERRRLGQAGEIHGQVEPVMPVDGHRCAERRGRRRQLDVAGRRGEVGRVDQLDAVEIRVRGRPANVERRTPERGLGGLPRRDRRRSRDRRRRHGRRPRPHQSADREDSGGGARAGPVEVHCDQSAPIALLCHRRAPEGARPHRGSRQWTLPTFSVSPSGLERGASSGRKQPGAEQRRERTPCPALLSARQQYRLPCCASPRVCGAYTWTRRSPAR